MQIRDLIAELQRHDPSDRVEIRLMLNGASKLDDIMPEDCNPDAANYEPVRIERANRVVSIVI